MLKWLSILLGLLASTIVAIVSGYTLTRHALQRQWQPKWSVRADPGAALAKLDPATADAQLPKYDNYVAVGTATFVFTTYFTWWLAFMTLYTAYDVARLSATLK